MRRSESVLQTLKQHIKARLQAAYYCVLVLQFACSQVLRRSGEYFENCYKVEWKEKAEAEFQHRLSLHCAVALCFSMAQGSGKIEWRSPKTQYLVRACNETKHFMFLKRVWYIIVSSNTTGYVHNKLLSH